MTLLGQPCILQGPFDEPTLKKIHAIGPAQVYPNLSASDLGLSARDARNSLTKVRSFQGLPPVFDGYQKRLSKRLEAELAFLNGLETFQKVHQTQPLFDIAKIHVRSKNLKDFEALLKKLKLSSNLGAPQYKALMEQLLDSYNESIEADPEEEFHRALKRLKIKYVCSFEELEAPSETSDDSE